ncbi:MAG TPA: hypothetical protein VEB43_21765 [Anaeromyxobacter sp.]|nr:hypothetical protein [Anaeromyxobacter sp.]
MPFDAPPAVPSSEAQPSGPDLPPAPQRSAPTPPFVFMGLVWLALFVQACGHTHGAVQHLAGRPVHLGAMLRAGFGRLLAVLGLVALGVLAYLGFALVLVSVGAVFSHLGGSGFVAAALAVISVPFLLVLGTALSLTIPVIVAERAGPIGGPRRSWALTRGRRVELFVALLVVVLVLAAVLAAQVGLVVATQLDAGGIPDTGPAISIGLMLLMLVVWILAAPLLSILPAVAYHDLRLEKEGSADLAQVFQ